MEEQMVCCIIGIGEGFRGQEQSYFLPIPQTTLKKKRRLPTIILGQCTICVGSLGVQAEGWQPFIPADSDIVMVWWFGLVRGFEPLLVDT